MFLWKIGQKGNLELVKVLGFASYIVAAPTCLFNVAPPRVSKNLQLSPDGGLVFRVYISKMLTVILPHVLGLEGSKKEDHIFIMASCGVMYALRVACEVSFFFLICS